MRFAGVGRANAYRSRPHRVEDMSDGKRSLSRLRQDHPFFFWGTLGIVLLMLAATAAVAVRIPTYQRDAALLDQQMDAQEKAVRDRILQARGQRAELAVALLRRELRIKALQQKGVHLAINLEDSTLSLRHGKATLRQVPVAIGPDSIIRAPDGRTWRFVRGLGERHLDEKQVSPDTPIPEWVYISRGEPVPPEEERSIEGGMGHYILKLDDGTEIYSKPRRGPLAEQVRPAGFMVEEKDLRAIFDAIKTQAPVYIY